MWKPTLINNDVIKWDSACNTSAYVELPSGPIASYPFPSELLKKKWWNGCVLTTAGGITGVDILQLKRLVPVANPVTLPASIKFVATMVGPPVANEAVFHVLAFDFNQAVG